jgi:hypothetical protein
MTIELAAQGSFYFGFDHITVPGEFDVSDCAAMPARFFQFIRERAVASKIA